MAKPWAKYAQNYINHPKFLALTANAICLWLEGKNYCDMHQTDGLIPRTALKTFRFYSSKSLRLLMRSCGLKPSGEEYVPLWEAHVVGFKMHDYLDHNDCRDEVVQRIEDADDQDSIRRLANKLRQRKHREDRKAKIAQLKDELSDVTRHAVTRDVTRDRGGPTATATATATIKDLKNGSSEARSEPAAPAFLVLPVVGPGSDSWSLSEAQVAEWAELYPTLDVRAECRKARAWLQANPGRRKTARGMTRFLLAWLGRANDTRRIPAAAVAPATSVEWTCPHTPACTGRNACHVKQQIEKAKAS